MERWRRAAAPIWLQTTATAGRYGKVDVCAGVCGRFAACGGLPTGRIHPFVGSSLLAIAQAGSPASRLLHQLIEPSMGSRGFLGSRCNHFDSRPFVPELREVEQGFDGFGHVLQADPFALAVHLMHAAEKVGAGEAARR